MQALALSYVMAWEQDQAADAEIRRDRMVLIAPHPENSDKIFQIFKTKDERARQETNPLDAIPEEEITEAHDPELAKVIEQMRRVGMAVQEI